jgi:hypothetical protein
MKFTLEACCVVLSTSLVDGKAAVLSLDKDQIVLPTISIDEINISSIDNTLIVLVKDLVAISPTYIVPQLISIKPKENDCGTIVVYYGFLIPEQVASIKTYWLEFNYTNSKTQYANLIIEVIQKLK